MSSYSHKDGEWVVARKVGLQPDLRSEGDASNRFPPGNERMLPERRRNGLSIESSGEELDPRHERCLG
jgi:hypothetical protein